MSFESPTLVRVTNEGDRPFSDGYASVKYTILPGKTVVVPWEAATLWLGDPRLVDEEDRALFPRTEEVGRVLVRNGLHLDPEGPPQTDPERLVERAPKLKVADIDGEVIVMLAGDPTGETALPAKFTRGDADDLRGELDRLKAEQARLLDMLERQANANTAPGLDSVLDDAPSKVPVSPGGFSGSDFG